MLTRESTDHWIAVLEAAGVPCGPVNNIAQALAHPQTAARNMLISVDDPVTGPLELAGNPMKLSGFSSRLPLFSSGSRSQIGQDQRACV